MYKQITYPKSHHCPRGSDELRNYLDDLEFATKFVRENSNIVGKSVKPGATKPSSLKIDKYPEPELEVVQYLHQYTTLVDVLERSVPQLIAHFGSQVACEFDLLEEGQHKKLFVKILTKLSADEALERLDAFDKNWWFKESIDARRNLEFVLEFQ